MSVFRIPYSVFRIPYLSNTARALGGAALIFGGAFGWAGEAAAQQPKGTYYPLYSAPACIVNTPNIDYTIGNLANIHSFFLTFSVDCPKTTPTVKNPNSAAPWNRIITDPAVVYCWHMHGTATAANNSLRSTDPGPAQAADPAKGIPYIAPRSINFRYYSQSMGVTDESGDAGYVVVGSAGGLTRYNVTGMASFTNFCGDNTYCSHVWWSSQVEMRFEENDLSQPFPAGDYNYSALRYHGTFNVIQSGAMPSYGNACRNATGSDVGGEVWGPVNFFQIHVKTYCTLKVPKPLNFGTVASLHNVPQADAVVNANCSAGTTYKLSFSNGDNFSGGQRYMRRVADNNSRDTSPTISYNIAFPVDKNCSDNVCNGTGEGLPEGTDYHITGTVPRQNTPPDGTYRDVIVVTMDRTSQY